jgi:hypothetical protein
MYVIHSFKTALSAPKSGNFQFTWLGLFQYSFIQLSTSLLSMLFYILMPAYLSSAYGIQDTLLIFLLFFFRLLHRLVATESNIHAAASYFISGPSLVLVLLIIATGFSLEYPEATAVNIFHIFEYKILIQGTLAMGTSYLLAGLLSVDSIIVFGLYLSSKESGVKTTEIVLQLFSLLTFLTFMEVIIKISF